MAPRNILVEDIFVVHKLIKHEDPMIPCYVTQIEAKTENNDMLMQLDVNQDKYPMIVDDRFLMALATTLNVDGKAESADPTGHHNNQEENETLANNYEYYMTGKLFSSIPIGISQREIIVRFGGVRWMLLIGKPSYFAELEPDQVLHVLIRKLDAVVDRESLFASTIRD